MLDLRELPRRDDYEDLSKILRSRIHLEGPFFKGIHLHGSWKELRVESAEVLGP
jgi:hypothetical protein